MMKYNHVSILIPEEWQAGTLADFLEESKERNKFGEQIPVYSISNIKGFVLQSEHFARNIHSKETSNYKLFFNDCFGFNPARVNVGSIALNDNIEIGLLSPMYVVFRTKESLSSSYLKYFVQTYDFHRCVLNNTAGSVRESLNFSEFENFPFICPKSLAEQTQIAAILSTVDQAIEQTEAMIAKYQRIKTGLMQDLLTKGIDEQGNLRTEATHEFKDSPLGRIPVEWEVEKLSLRANIRGGKRLPLGHKYAETDTGCRYLQTTDFIGKKLLYSNMHFLHRQTFEHLQRYEITEGDVFISIAGVNLGVAGVFRPDISDKTILTENAAKIQLLGNEIPEYLATQINGPLGQGQINLDKGIGGGVPKLALFRIENILIPWPKISEQEKILSILNGLESHFETEMYNLSKYYCLKTGLMQDLLTGRVRVTGLL